MNFSIQEQDVKVAEYLNQQKIRLEPTHTMEAIHKNEEWKHDKFLICITGKDGNVETFEYSTGLGHRISVRENMSPFAMMPSKTIRALKEAATKMGYNVQDFKKKAVHVIQDNSGFSRARVCDRVTSQWIVKPTQASVLYSLLLDSSCCQGSFNDYCDEFGEDSDSISAREPSNNA